MPKISEKEKINKYYFEFALYFEKDYDVSELENILDIKPTKLVKYNESKGNVKTAKFIFKTEEFDEIYSDYKFKKFVKSYKDSLKNIFSILKENNGRLEFCVVFTELNDKPIVSLDKETIHILSELDADFEIDYS